MATKATLIRRSLRGVNAEIADRAIRHAVYLQRYSTTTARKIVRFLDRDVIPDVLANVQRRLARVELGVDPGPWTTKRYMDMLAANAKIVGTAMEDARLGLTSELVNLSKVEGTFSTKLMEQSAESVGADLANVEFTVPSNQLLKSIVTERPMQGALLEDWFEDMAKITVNRISKEINVGVATGEGIDKIVRRLIGADEEGGRGGAFGFTRRGLDALTRTSVSHTVNHARNATYLENPDLVEAYKWVATLDDRTTQQCMALDGQVFDLNDGPLPPLHVNCRSTTVPVVKKFEGEKDIEFKRTARDPETGEVEKVSGKIDYEDWLRGQPPEVQDDILGTGKAEVFRRGDLPLGKFVDENFKPLTLEQLEEIERKI